VTGSSPPRTAPSDVTPYLHRLGLSDTVPRRPVLRGTDGTLITVPLPADGGPVEYRGVYIGPAAAELVGPPAPAHGLSKLRRLPGVAGQVTDLFVEASQIYLERTEELDRQLAALEERGPQVPTAEVWKLERRAARLREQEGRAVEALAELGRLSADGPLKFGNAIAPLETELERTAELTRSVQQGLAALILLWNTEHGNRLAQTANELGAISNRIAELQNISNLRMLGITYIVLLLALVAAAISIPNTAATILGMPSAAWVPGIWVDVILIVLATLPIAVIFSRKWILTFLREFGRYEARSSEGIADLPERIATAPPERPGRST
jgi:hypothetical protein